MTGSPAVISALLQAANLEVTLQLQYHLDHRLLKQMGLKKSGKRSAEWGEDAECFLEKIVDRILFLEGIPNYTASPTEDADSVTALLERERTLNLDLIPPYEALVELATKEKDDTSRNLIEHLLKWHEKHLKALERELELIEMLGETDYISARI